MLNNIARNCYSNSEIGATSYSINLDTVLGVLADGVTDANTTERGSQPNTYSGRFPTVWYDNERISWSDADGNKSKEYGLIPGGYSSEKYGTDISPYCNYWSGGGRTCDKWKSQTYYEMMVEPTRDKQVWLATRSCDPGYTRNYCIFGLESMSFGAVGHVKLFGSDGFVDSYNFNVRPLVQINLSNITLP